MGDCEGQAMGAQFVVCGRKKVRGTHEVVAAVADGEMVEFFEGDAALTLADVAGN